MSSVHPLALKAKLPTASNYQIAVFDAFTSSIKTMRGGDSPDNLMVRAVAGSGKTSTLAACTRLIPPGLQSLFVTFAVRNADDLKDKTAGANVDVRTLNSLGHRIWTRYIAGRDNAEVEVNRSKIYRIIRDVITSPSSRANFSGDIRKLVGMARAVGLVPQGVRDCVSVNGIQDDRDTWLSIMYHADVYASNLDTDRLIEWSREVLALDIEDEHTIDYEDQLYFPVVKRSSMGSHVPMFKYDIVVIDEAQDLNPIQHDLVALALKDNGLFVAVGDPKQAIYAFRGADIHSMDNLRARFNAVSLPLSISYRCAKSIVEHAKGLNEEIEALPSAPEGAVVKRENFALSNLKPGDMVICRNNAPLITMAYKLIKARIPVKVWGRDIGSGLIRIIDKLKHNGSLATMARLLDAWKVEQIKLILAKDPDDEDAVQRIMDRYESIVAFINETTSPTVEAIKKEIEALFIDTPDKDKVIMSTIHKSKGLEAETVYILDAQLLYPPWIKLGSWKYQQEVNIDYVARTRAKLNLVYIFSKGLS